LSSCEAGCRLTCLRSIRLRRTPGALLPGQTAKARNRQAESTEGIHRRPAALRLIARWWTQWSIRLPAGKSPRWADMVRGCCRRWRRSCWSAAGRCPRQFISRCFHAWPISRLAAERLVQLVVPEQDVLVWHDALSAVRAAPGEDAIRLAYAGLSHPEPEVRRLACELLAERPDPRHLKLLAPALEDRHPAVRLAATGAWGLSARSAHVTAAHALRRLAARGSAEERLSAAVAMAQAGDPAGKAALERLCFHPDPEIRRRVAQQMGELADPEFAPSLVRLLDDQLSVARAALESLPKVVGRDVAARQEDPPPDTAERMRRWREWFRQQGAGRFKAGLKAAAGVASEYHGTDAGRY